MNDCINLLGEKTQATEGNQNNRKTNFPKMINGDFIEDKFHVTRAGAIYLYYGRGLSIMNVSFFEII